MSQREHEYDPSGSIAMFIAAALQHPNPTCNGHNPLMSTIRVEQHKNKFDRVIVYCELADTNLVSQSWVGMGKGNGDPPDEFIQACMYRDAEIYRHAYRRMLSLVPELREMILSRADYAYLLYDTTRELDAWLNTYEQNNVNHLIKKWRVPDVAALRMLLHKAYKRGW